MLEKLGFDFFKILGEIFFFFVIGTFTCSNGAVDAPVCIVGAKGVIITTTSSPLLGGCVRGKVGDRFHSHLVGERLAVSKFSLETLTVLHLLDNGLASYPALFYPALRIGFPPLVVKSLLFCLPCLLLLLFNLRTLACIVV